MILGFAVHSSLDITTCCHTPQESNIALIPILWNTYSVAQTKNNGKSAKLRICLSQLHFFVSFNQTRTVVSIKCAHSSCSNNFSWNALQRTSNVDFMFAKLRRTSKFDIQKWLHVCILLDMTDHSFITHLQRTSIETLCVVSRFQQTKIVFCREKMKRVFAEVRA